MGWLSGYTYRKSITLSRASGAVSNYQMRLAVGEGSLASATSTKFCGLGAATVTAPYDDEAWVGITNIYADDASYASITATSFDTNDYSRLAHASLFGHAIPLSATIKGIEVIVQRYYANGTVVDGTVRLSKDNSSAVGDDKADTSTEWPDSATDKTYGGAADLWGTTWTPAEINSPNFSVFFACKATGDDADAYVDFIKTVVYYQAAVYCDGHVLSTFNDLRFTNSAGTELDYWIELLDGSTPNQIAQVWVEFDSIGTSATTFYMYYGDADAAAASNGANTFVEFDDFERGSNGDAIGGDWTIDAGDVDISTGQKWGGTRSMKLIGDTAGGIATIAQTAGTNYAIMLRWYKEDAAYFRVDHGDGTERVYIRHNTDEVLASYNGGYTTLATVTADAWHLMEINDINHATPKYDLWVDGLNVGNDCDTYLSASYANKVMLRTADIAAADVWVDNYLVRQWVATEPAWGSWGSEESGWQGTFCGVSAPAEAIGVTSIEEVNGVA